MRVKWKKEWLVVTSLGYNAPGLRDGSKPDHPSMSLFLGTRNLSGSNSWGRSQKYGDRWRLYTWKGCGFMEKMCTWWKAEKQEHKQKWWKLFYSLKERYQSQQELSGRPFYPCIHLHKQTFLGLTRVLKQGNPSHAYNKKKKAELVRSLSLFFSFVHSLSFFFFSFFW